MKHRAAALFLASLTYAQTQPSFEVTSVKPSNSADHRALVQFQPGGRLTVANMSVKSLIQTAYNIKVFQISGGPAWMDTDVFDIVAKPDEPPAGSQIQPMLQSLEHVEKPSQN